MKNSVLALSARIFSTVMLMSSTALTIQADAHSTIAGDADPIDFDAAISAMRAQNDQIRHMADELVGTIQDRQLADPAAFNDFDHDALAATFVQMGLISDVDTFNQAAVAVKSGGFISYISDATTRMSSLDETFTDASQKLSTWAMLDEEARDTAVLTGNTDNPMPALAQMQTSVNQFANYVTAGKLIYANLTQSNNTDAGQIAEANQRDLVEA